MENERLFLKIRQVANTVIGPVLTGFIAYVNLKEFDAFFANLTNAWPFVIALPFSYIFALSLWLEHYGEKFGRWKTGLAFTIASMFAAFLFWHFRF